MHSKGHFGLALLVMSLISIPFGFGTDNIMIIIIFLTAILSSIPDIDLKFEIAHRTITHNILFAIIIGIIFGVIFGYASGIVYGFVGFLAGLMAVLVHLLGDLMTHMKFKPLYPFSKKETAWHWFYADSQTANNGFFTLGIIAFFGYVFLSSGALESFI